MNLQVKLSIIEELKELVESPDDANKSLSLIHIYIFWNLVNSQ